MAELLDTDLMLVNRGGVSYKVTGAEVKNGLNPPIAFAPSVIAPADGAGVAIGAVSDEIIDLGEQSSGYTSEFTITGKDFLGSSPFDPEQAYLMFDGDKTTYPDRPEGTGVDWKQEITWTLSTPISYSTLELIYYNPSPASPISINGSFVTKGTGVDRPELGTFIKSVTLSSGVINTMTFGWGRDGGGGTWHELPTCLIVDGVVLTAPYPGTVLTFASDKDFTGDPSFKSGDRIEQDSGHTPQTSAITGVSDINVVRSSTIQYYGSMSNDRYGSDQQPYKMFQSDGQFSFDWKKDTSGAYWTMELNQTCSKFGINCVSSGGTSSIKVEATDSDNNYHVLWSKGSLGNGKNTVDAPGGFIGTLKVSAPDLQTGSDEYGTFKELLADGVVMSDGYDQVELTLTDDTDLENFRVGDPVTGFSDAIGGNPATEETSYTTYTGVGSANIFPPNLPKTSWVTVETTTIGEGPQKDEVYEGYVYEFAEPTSLVSMSYFGGGSGYVVRAWGSNSPDGPWTNIGCGLSPIVSNNAWTYYAFNKLNESNDTTACSSSTVSGQRMRNTNYGVDTSPASSITVTSIDKDNNQMTISDGTWNTGDDVLGPTTIPATGTVASTNSGTNTMVLSDSDETLPKRWIVNQGKFVQGEQFPSKDAATSTTPASICSNPFFSNDEWASTDWQVASDVNFGTVVASVTGHNDPTNWTVEPELEGDTQYWIRAQHNGVSGAVSGYGPANKFETEKPNPLISVGEIWSTGNNTTGEYRTFPVKPMIASWGQSNVGVVIGLDNSIMKWDTGYTNGTVMPLTLADKEIVAIGGDSYQTVIFEDGTITRINTNNNTFPMENYTLPSGKKAVDFACGNRGGQFMVIDEDGKLFGPAASSQSPSKASALEEISGTTPAKSIRYEVSTTGTIGGLFAISKNDNRLRMFRFDKTVDSNVGLSLTSDDPQGDATGDITVQYKGIAVGSKSISIGLTTANEVNVIMTGASNHLDSGVTTPAGITVKQIACSADYAFVLSTDGRVFMVGGLNSCPGPWVGGTAPTKGAWGELALPKPIPTLSGAVYNAGAADYGFLIPD